ncbi:MAG: CpsD/CapB family tyrosine-protein kinase, partial [Micropepsaceae bacterium]
VVPEMKDGVEPQAAVVRRAGSSFTESIRGLNLSLMTMDAGTSPPKVILVTSAVGGEGKTVVAASLARLAAKTGRKVALVEADFRRPSLARAMNVSTAFGGIAQALKGDLPVERCMMTDELLPGVSVLACNEAVRDPSETLASGAMEALLANLKAKYDLVIVDAAPLLPVHDTWPLTRIADATLLLVHAGRTSREDVLAAVRALRTMHARVAGVALTRSAADPRGAYRDYIGDEADSSSKPHLLQFSIHPKTERRAQS